MKAVVCQVPDFILEWRERTGANRYDEVWDGVLHMAPISTGGHEDFVWEVQTFLRMRWAKSRQAKARPMNVSPPGGWPHNYRVPDMIIWKRDRDERDKSTHFEGAPNVAIEVRSPDDESYTKLSFCAELGTPEVWILDRDTRTPEMYSLKGRKYERVLADAAGWIVSGETQVQFKSAPGGKLAIRIGTDDSTLALLPED